MPHLLEIDSDIKSIWCDLSKRLVNFSISSLEKTQEDLLAKVLKKFSPCAGSSFWTATWMSLNSDSHCSTVTWINDILRPSSPANAEVEKSLTYFLASLKIVFSR
jgi:hypothetical protein